MYKIKAFMKLFAIALIISLFLTLLFMLIFTSANLEEDYIKLCENHKLLTSVREQVVLDGKGLDVSKLPSETVKYTINIKEDVIFIKLELISDDGHYINLELSKQYEVLAEIYSKTVPNTFEEYEDDVKEGKYICAGIVSFCMTALVFTMLYVTVSEELIEQEQQKYYDRLRNYKPKSILGRFPLATRDKTIYFTPKRFWMEVLKNIKSTFTLRVSVKEILKVCDMHNFPKKYSVDIKLAILNYYASSTNYLFTDKSVIANCYNSLPLDNIEALYVRKKFLKKFIECITCKNIITRFGVCSIDENTSYSAFKLTWIEEKFNKYILESELDFAYLDDLLTDEFQKEIKAEIDSGNFTLSYTYS